MPLLERRGARPERAGDLARESRLDRAGLERVGDLLGHELAVQRFGDRRRQICGVLGHQPVVLSPGLGEGPPLGVEPADLHRLELTELEHLPNRPGESRPGERDPVGIGRRPILLSGPARELRERRARPVLVRVGSRHGGAERDRGVAGRVGCHGIRRDKQVGG